MNLWIQKVTVQEVAVVCLILAVLLAITIPAVDYRPTSPRATDTAMCISIKTAIIQYRSDYGELPQPAGSNYKSGDLFLGAAPGKPPTQVLPGTVALFQALYGNINAKTGLVVKTELNFRNTQYLSLRKDHVDQNGVPLQYFTCDGKDAYFTIGIDADYNNEIVGVPDPVNGDFSRSVTDTVAVWSCNDQPYDKPNFKWSRSW